MQFGYSDHTNGIEVCIAAAALGATVLEKHFTLDRSMGGPDSKFSLEPDEFRNLVDDIRNAELAEGTIKYGPVPAEVNSVHFRRSLYVVKDIGEGEEFNSENNRSTRPALGIKPKFYEKIIGKLASRNLSAGTPLCFSDVEGVIE